MHEKIHQYGYVNSIKRIIKSILRKIGIRHEQYLYCVKELQGCEIKKLPPKIQGEIKELNNDLILNSSLIQFSDRKLELFKKRLRDENYIGFGFFHHNLLIYYTWISYKEFSMSIPSQGIILASDEALIIDSYCHPNYRQYGIHQYMNDFRIEQIKNKGKTKVVAIVLKENIPARNTQRKSGFECIKLIVYNKLFTIYERTRIVNTRIDL